ncbi:unnamed protein product [Caenorhabditis brenneri]
MDSIPRRAKFRVGKMINSAVAVVNSSTLRRRSHFARSATTNSYGPIPIDGEGSSPLMYSSQRSNSTTSSTNSIVSIPGVGAVSNLIKVRSLEQSMESELNQITLSEINERGEIVPYNSSDIVTPKPTAKEEEDAILGQFIKIVEFMYITDNLELLDLKKLEKAKITHVISVGHNFEGHEFSATSFLLFHEIDVESSQSFKILFNKFDRVNCFIENARKVVQKAVIYCPHIQFAYFVAAVFNSDYYDLEIGKTVNHLMKNTGTNWVEIPKGYVDILKEWRKLCSERRSQSATERKLGLSISILK